MPRFQPVFRSALRHRPLILRLFYDFFIGVPIEYLITIHSARSFAPPAFGLFDFRHGFIEIVHVVPFHFHGVQVTSVKEPLIRFCIESEDYPEFSGQNIVYFRQQALRRRLVIPPSSYQKPPNPKSRNSESLELSANMISIFLS
jgi:hypothetical protein